MEETTNQMKEYSIVIPAYNEADKITATLTQVATFLNGYAEDYEILVVDDGSKDSTAQKVAAYAVENPKVHLIKNAHKGKGIAVWTGVMRSQGKYIYLCDADLSTPISELKKLAVWIKDHDFDIVIASREGVGAQRINEPHYRHILGRGFNLLTKIIAIPEINDTQCGFKLFKHHVAKEIFSQLKVYNPQNEVLNKAYMGAFDVEVLYIALKYGHRIKEVPVIWKYVKTSRLAPITDSLRMLWDVIKIRIADRKGLYVNKNSHKSKRIIFMVPSFPVKSETFIERELYFLSQRETVDIRIFSLKKSADFIYPELNKRVDYVKLVPSNIIRGFFAFLFSNPVKLFETFKLCTKNKTKSFIDNVYIWLKSLGYAYLFKRTSAEQIHAHFFSEFSTIGMCAAKLLNIKFSISGHAKDVFENAPKTDFGPELVAEKIAFCEFAALCNKKAYDTCVNLAGAQNKAKIHLEYHGVDFFKAKTLEEDVVEKNPQFTLVFVGRFVEKKGLIYLLEAMKMVSNMKLKIAGFGPKLQEFLAFIKKNSLEGKVEIVNNGLGVDNNTTLKLVNNADLVVVPSIDSETGDSDGIPNVILEAGLFGKPVITTNAGSISEIIVNGKTGFIVDQKDATQIAEAIKVLENDAGLRNKLGSALREIVKNKFDIQHNITKLEKLLLG